MKTVCKLNQCTGCMACIDICPKQAIRIKDSLNSYNAVINEKLCVSCNLCHKVCQNNNEVEYLNPIDWKQGWRKDPELRAQSSSGGAAASLMTAFAEKYGTVCSCVFQNGEFRFQFAENAEDISKFIGSKYVKSNPEGIYKQVRRKLANGQPVLFVGLPCQVEALKIFVGEKYQNKLYTVDLICHGSPSPKFLQMFLQEYGYSLESVEEITFRKKAHFHLSKDYVGMEPESVTDTYTHAFLNCLDYTENCYDCKYARKERISDLTIGDSWGSELPKEEQDKGISLILCQTEKGRELLMESDMELFPVDSERAIAYNRQLRHPSLPPIQREKFLKCFRKSIKFSLSVRKAYPKVFIKQAIKKLLIVAKIRGG